MHKATTLVLLLPLFALAQNTSGYNDKRIASLDTAFQRVLKTWNAPGFSVVVVEKNRIIYAKGFGFRDVEKKLPATPQTIYPIGSCTKAFTTSLIGILQKEGKLDIDKPVHQYLPDLNFYSEQLTNQVNLRDMMSHRTGLPRHDYSWYLFSTANRDSLYRRIQYQEPTYPIRTTWQYNNFMFVAQGSVAEKLTGKSWEDNIREKILEPLRMSSTVMTIADMQKSPEAAKGYALKKDSQLVNVPYYHINAAGPAGSINSSVMDMSRWLITWIHGGKYGDKEIVPSVFAKDAMSSQAVISSGFPSKERPELHFANYGFGWFLSSYKGHYRVEHGGNIDGFSANTTFFPTDSIGIVVLCNQDGSSVPSIVRNIIADRLLQKPYYNWNGELKAAADKAKAAAAETLKSAVQSQVKGTRPSHELKDYEGIYSHPGYGSFDVFLRNDSLFARTPNQVVWLKHYHYDVFSPYLLGGYRSDPNDPTNTRIQFHTGLNGEIESLNTAGFESPTIQLNFKKTPRTKAVTKNELEQYAGSYFLGQLEAKFYTRGNTLYLFVEGQPEYELIPTGDDKFSVKNLDGFSVQFLKQEGKVNAVNLIQPNGTFKATKK